MSETNDDNRGCMRLAQAYIPIQRYGETFDPYKALRSGTLFPELYRPYRPRTNA